MSNQNSLINDFREQQFLKDFFKKFTPVLKKENIFTTVKFQKDNSRSNFSFNEIQKEF